MKKLTWKHRIYIAISAGLIFGMVMFITSLFFEDNPFSAKNIMSLFLQAILYGAGMGFLFPAVLEKIAPRLATKVKTPNLQKDEFFISEEPANYFHSKWMAVGGKIFLTNTRIIFHSHAYNLQKEKISIPLEEIEEITHAKFKDLLNNGITIQLKNGKIQNFVLENREVFLAKLTENAYIPAVR